MCGSVCLTRQRCGQVEQVAVNVEKELNMADSLQALNAEHCWEQDAPRTAEKANAVYEEIIVNVLSFDYRYTLMDIRRVFFLCSQWKWQK